MKFEDKKTLFEGWYLTDTSTTFPQFDQIHTFIILPIPFTNISQFDWPPSDIQVRKNVIL